MADNLQSMTEGLDLFNTTAHSYRIIVLIICSNAITLPISRRVYLVKLFVVRFFSREVIYHVSAIHVSTIRVAIKYVQVMESLETRNAKPTAANTKRYLHHLQLY